MKISQIFPIVDSSSLILELMLISSDRQYTSNCSESPWSFLFMGDLRYNTFYDIELLICIVLIVYMYCTRTLQLRLMDC